MHIVLINHYAGSSEMGMEFRPYYLAKEWIKLGHKVTIVAGTYSHIRRVNKTQKIWMTSEDIEGIRYIWIRTREYSGNGVGRVLSMLDFISGLYRLSADLKKERIDAVIASSTYPLDNYPAYSLAKKTDARYIYEVHDLWPLSPMKLGGYSKWHPFIFVMQLAENFAYKHVDKVVSILPCAEEHMREHGLKAGRFEHIPNGIYLPEVENPEPLQTEMKNGIPKDKTIIGYCGTFGKANALEKLVEVADRLRDSYPDIFFCLVGKGPEKDHIMRLIEDKKLDNIRVYDAIPKNQVQSFLKMCDIITIVWENSDLYRYGISPNKLFDYMYSEKPVIQSVIAGNDILRDAKCGITSGTEVDDIYKAILAVYQMSESEKTIMGQNGKNYVIKNHEYSILATQFLGIIK